ncbi:non-ribosomal peptide synthetase [Xenorhabdus vietnamensis]|uniref:Non-ribosomal peptide synthetase n=2 Tax=Xenorhabdus vietnamensis TaxID=351656 RepID=A0A1Y2S5V6_9GAMM|nr:non-ribosomal peptide synthetase [Xenorhabdus vietnamensis]
MMASENADPLLLNINGGVQAGQLGFSIASRLSEEKSQQFKAAFETALDLVINTAQMQAAAGGQRTLSDYGNGLFSNGRLNEVNERLNHVLEKFQAPKNEEIDTDSEETNTFVLEI